MSKSNNDNRANQLNPNNSAYWQSRGYDSRADGGGQAMEKPAGSPAAQPAVTPVQPTDAPKK